MDKQVKGRGLRGRHGCSAAHVWRERQVPGPEAKEQSSRWTATSLA